MLFQEYFTNENYYRGYVSDFLDKYPKFKEAVILKTPHDSFKVPGYIFSSYNSIFDIWLVELRGKQYMIGLNEPYGRRWPKFIQQRYYPEGTKPKQKRNRIDINYSMRTVSTERNDCQIVTLSKVLDQPYDLVLDLMKAGGWIPSDAGNHQGSRWEYMMDMCNKEMKEVWCRFKYKKNNNVNGKVVSGMTVKSALKHFPEGTFVINVRGHVLSMIDGELFDTWNSQNCRVLSIYEIKDKD